MRMLIGVIAAMSVALTLNRERPHHVVDGDTFAIVQSGKQVLVHLRGIDCPERWQHFYYASKTFTSESILNKWIHLSSVVTDSVGELHADVFTSDGRWLNKALVAEGLAWVVPGCERENDLKILEEEARRQQIGLWAAPNPQPPWQKRR